MEYQLRLRRTYVPCYVERCVCEVEQKVQARCTVASRRDYRYRSRAGLYHGDSNMHMLSTRAADAKICPSTDTRSKRLIHRTNVGSSGT